MTNDDSINDDTSFRLTPKGVIVTALISGNPPLPMVVAERIADMAVDGLAKHIKLSGAIYLDDDIEVDFTGFHPTSTEPTEN